MKKAEEYRQHAAECRQLASKGDTKAREQLLKMADTWDSLAVDREMDIARQERIKALEAGGIAGAGQSLDTKKDDAPP
jgi:hypothetical protein